MFTAGRRRKRTGRGVEATGTDREAPPFYRPAHPPSRHGESGPAPRSRPRPPPFRTAPPRRAPRPHRPLAPGGLARPPPGGGDGGRDGPGDAAGTRGELARPEGTAGGAGADGGSARRSAGPGVGGSPGVPLPRHCQTSGPGTGRCFQGEGCRITQAVLPL